LTNLSQIDPDNCHEMIVLCRVGRKTLTVSSSQWGH